MIERSASTRVALDVGTGRAAPRLERLLPGDLDDDQRAVFTAITEGPRAAGPRLFQVIGEDGALEGPFNALLLQPRLGMAVQALGSAVRYATTLADRAREIAILVVATRWRSEFEWYAHEAVGRHAGLDEDELSAVLHRRYDVLTNPTERLVARIADHLAYNGELDDAEFEESAQTIGRPQLFEVSTLVGYYAMLALQLKVFRVALPDGVQGVAFD
jgi:4-carboxymuconolactone decarboxylase